MKTAWTAGTKDAERNKEIRASFAAGLVLRKRLKNFSCVKLKRLSKHALWKRVMTLRIGLSNKLTHQGMRER